MAKKFSVIIGIILILIGLLAFTSNTFISSSVGAYFQTSAILNILYIIFGIILLIAAYVGESAAALWLTIIGVVYLILFIDGLFQANNLFGFIGANMADAWLHLIVGIILLLAGMAKRKPMVETSVPPMTTM